MCKIGICCGRFIQNNICHIFSLWFLCFAHLSAHYVYFSLFVLTYKFISSFIFRNSNFPPDLYIFPTKGALPRCDFTHGGTHGRMHNYLTILPTTTARSQKLLYLFLHIVYISFFAHIIHVQKEQILRCSYLSPLKNSF